MYKLVKDFPDDIIFEEEGPFISLYQPSHRNLPDRNKDPIVFKNLIQEIENSLEKQYRKSDRQSILRSFDAIKNDRVFWSKTLDGLAVLANPRKCVVYKLPRPVPELAVVADSLHIKPLLRFFQSADQYQLLGLSRGEFTLYEGSRYGFAEIELDPGTPRTITDVLGEEYTEPHLSHRSSGGSGGAVFHGSGGKRDEIDKDMEKFFRYVDRFVLENYSKTSGLPLILVALAEYHAFFKKVSRNPYLMEEGIKDAYDSLDLKKLRENVWKIIEPLYLEKTKILVGSFEKARAGFLGSDDLAQIARAALEHRVGTLLIEASRIVPGKIHRPTAKLELGEFEYPEGGDLLNELAGLVYRSRGEVVVLPAERMPAKTGAAAIYRY